MQENCVHVYKYTYNKLISMNAGACACVCVCVRAHALYVVLATYGTVNRDLSAFTV